jgi:hypothetical protein
MLLCVVLVANYHHPSTPIFVGILLSISAGLLYMVREQLDFAG